MAAGRVEPPGGMKDCLLLTAMAEAGVSSRSSQGFAKCFIGTGRIAFQEGSLRRVPQNFDVRQVLVSQQGSSSMLLPCTP